MVPATLMIPYGNPMGHLGCTFVTKTDPKHQNNQVLDFRQFLSNFGIYTYPCRQSNVSTSPWEFDKLSMHAILRMNFSDSIPGYSLGIIFSVYIHQKLIKNHMKRRNNAIIIYSLLQGVSTGMSQKKFLLLLYTWGYRLIQYVKMQLGTGHFYGKNYFLSLHLWPLSFTNLYCNKIPMWWICRIKMMQWRSQYVSLNTKSEPVK